MDQIRKNNIAYAKLLNKCWDDPAYLEKFRADPAAALKEFGIPTPPNARYHIVAPVDMKPSTDEDVYLYYTERPRITTLDDKLLNKVAGGEVETSAGPQGNDSVSEYADAAVHVEAVADVAAATEVAVFVAATAIVIVCIIDTTDGQNQ